MSVTVTRVGGGRGAEEYEDGVHVAPELSKDGPRGDDLEADPHAPDVTRTPSTTRSKEYALMHKTRECDLKRVFGDFKKNPRQICAPLPLSPRNESP